MLCTLDDTEIFLREVKLADSVVNATSSDHLFAVQTLLDEPAGSGKAFIHTRVIGDDARGESASEQIFDEGTRYTPAPEKTPRATLDNLILDAAGRGVRSTILCHSVIDGNGLGVYACSVQIPQLVEQACRLGLGRGSTYGRCRRRLMSRVMGMLRCMRLDRIAG